MTPIDIADAVRAAGIIRGKPTIANIYDDAASTLARWFREEMSRRAMEAEVRAKPITAEWMESIGAYHEGDYGGEPGWFASDVGNGEMLSVEASTGEIYIFREDDGSMTRINRTFETRGQLLDLIAALKGGAT